MSIHSRRRGLPRLKVAIQLQFIVYNLMINDEAEFK